MTYQTQYYSGSTSRVGAIEHMVIYVVQQMAQAIGFFRLLLKKK